MRKDSLILLVGIILIIIWNVISYGIVDTIFMTGIIMVIYGIIRVFYRITMEE